MKTPIILLVPLALLVSGLLAELSFGPQLTVLVSLWYILWSYFNKNITKIEFTTQWVLHNISKVCTINQSTVQSNAATKNSPHLLKIKEKALLLKKTQGAGLMSNVKNGVMNMKNANPFHTAGKMFRIKDAPLKRKR